MSAFLSGRDLSRRFYEEAVRPLLAQYLEDIPYAAANLGEGSDVLGFDTEMSRDHDWGPAAHIFLRDEDGHLAEDIRQMLSRQLPHTFLGYPVNFDETPVEPGTFGMKMTSDGLVNHRVHIMTLQTFFRLLLAYGIDQPPDVAAWLTMPSQSLREVTAGAVHYDGVGELTELRQRLAWYPHDVWLYLLACNWQRIGQEEHLMPRAGFVGDELGSAIIGSRLVRDAMSLCFLMEKQYAPYPKWFGTAFKQLRCADQLWPILWQAQISSTWQEREAALCEAYELLAHMHNALGITGKMPETVSPFFNRPFKIIHGGEFAQALVEQITDNEVKRVASQRLIGSIDQFSDNTDLRCVTDWRPILRQLYE
jgi:Domain of unknown function (DUF4037)